MTISATVGEKSAAISPDASQTLAIVAYASGATANTVYSPSNPAAVQPAVGDGPLCMLGAAVTRLAKRRVILISPSTSGGTVGTVTETPAGPGPTISVSGTPRYTLDSVKVKVTKAGAGGVGQFKLALDGYTYGPVRDIPAPTKASLLGTVDMATLTYGGGGTLHGLTLILQADVGGSQTVTFSNPTDIADVATQVNAQTTSMTAAIRGNRLYIESDTAGASSTLVCSASSTAEIILGISTSAAAGAAGTFAVDNTGLTLTFPATSDYVLDTVYSFATRCPAFSASQLSTALAALLASGEKFGAIVLGQQFSDAFEARTMANQLATDIATMNVAKTYAVGLLGVPVFGADGVTAETDANAKTAFTGHVAADLAVSVGDVYMQGGGSDTGLSGSFRVPAHWYAAALAATNRYSADIGSGQYDPLTSVFSYVHPNGTTKARDERLASTTLREHGFLVLETRPQNAIPGPWFAVGYSRASAASKYRQWRNRRIIYRALDLCLGVLARVENGDYSTNPDGTLALFEKKALERLVYDVIKIDMLDPSPAHLAGMRVAIDGAEIVTTTDNLTVTVDAQPKMQAETITLTVNAVDVLLED
jgi:hypothetical protein